MNTANKENIMDFFIGLGAILKIILSFVFAPLTLISEIGRKVAGKESKFKKDFDFGVFLLGILANSCFILSYIFYVICGAPSLIVAICSALMILLILAMIIGGIFIEL